MSILLTSGHDDSSAVVVKMIISMIIPMENCNSLLEIVNPISSGAKTMVKRKKPKPKTKREWETGGFIKYQGPEQE